MSTSSSAFPSGSKSLSPEILLKIFLNLDCHQITIIRSVCKKFLEIIDNNKSLWRVLDWIQQKDGSALQALEKFDERSGSTLKEVSITQCRGRLDSEHLIQVLQRSKECLKYLSFSIPGAFDVRHKVIELASAAPILNSLVLWSTEIHMALFPKTHLTRRGEQSSLDAHCSSKLRVMWGYNSGEVWEGKLDVSSLVSFADPIFHDPLQLRSFITKFSTTLVHLSIKPDKDLGTPSLSLPSLRILEGRFYYGFPSWLDALNLRIMILSAVTEASMQGLPVSIQELWLLTPHESSVPAGFWYFLALICPKLEVLRLGKEMVKSVFSAEGISTALKSRQAKIEKGVQVEGIKLKSLEKIIVPTDPFPLTHLNDLREAVGEVIDLKDYPDFIELEY